MSAVVTNPVAKRNRRYLIIILALFALPPLAAWLLIDIWRPGGTVHHGELLDPARPLPVLQGHDIDGAPVDGEALRGHWIMVYLSEGEQCQESCRNTLYQMRQMQIALGKDSPRVQTVLLFTQEPQAEFLSWLQQEHRVMQKIILADQTIPDFMAEAFAAEVIEQGIYLIDPLSNVFMHYAPDADPSDILKDFRRLLKYSKIG